MTAAQTPSSDPTGGTSVLGDTVPPPQAAQAPLADDGSDIADADDDTDESQSGTIRGGLYALRDQAFDHARVYASDGKATLGETIGGYAETVRQAAQQIEDAAGPQVATYAHQAADFLEEAAESIRTKDVEELYDEARELIRRSPALALAGAAAIGFALSRFLKATSQQLEPTPATRRSRAAESRPAYDA